MSVKIRISYTEDEELQEVLHALSKMLRNAKVRPAKGGYRRAYITLNTGRSPGEHRERTMSEARKIKGKQLHTSR